MSPDTRTESGGYEIRSKIGLDKFSLLMEWKVESQFVKTLRLHDCLKNM